MTTKDEITVLAKSVMHVTYNSTGILINTIGGILFYAIMILSIVPTVVFLLLKSLFKKMVDKKPIN